MAAIKFLNGKEVEWADINVQIAGSPTAKFQSIKYGVKTEKKHLHAGGDDPISIQSGKREPTGSVKLLKGDVDVLNRAAIAAGGRDLTDLELDAVVTYRPKGLSRGLKIDTLVGIQISGYEYGMEENATEMPIELPFLYLSLTQA